MLDSSNLKTFFQFVNKRLSNKTTATFLIDTESQEKVFDDVKKADLLNKYFASVFTVDNKILPEFEARRAGNLNDVQFSEDNVRNALKKMKSSFSSDPDGLNSYFLKKLSFSICYPLSKIFGKSFTQGEIPDSWKIANVIPLFKKGDSSLVANYRPVSLCSVVCKLMESVINTKILDFLD